MTEADLVLYSMLTRDWADIHTDHHLVAKTVFRRPIAHAGLTLAVASGLMDPGADGEYPVSMSRIRFVKPAMVGDSVYLELRSDGEPRSRQVRIVNQRGEVLVESGFRLSGGVR